MCTSQSIIDWMPGGVDDLIGDAELIGRVLKGVAKDIEADYENQAKLIRMCIKRLEARAINALAPPEDTPPAGTYLDKLIAGLGFPYQHITPVAVKWLVRRLRESRTLVRKFLNEGEITAAPDLIGAAQRWLDKIDNGPGTDVMSEPEEGDSR